MKSYEMNAQMDVTKWGEFLTEKLMKLLPQTLEVRDVRDDKIYQKEDVDYLWQKKKGKMVKVEVKTDRWHHTGNYFFETISNTRKNTKGCFMYTEADALFYIYVFENKEAEIHILPLKKVRNWFVDEISKSDKTFPERSTSTRNKYGKVLYNSKGRIVPRKVVIEKFYDESIFVRFKNKKFQKLTKKELGLVS